MCKLSADSQLLFGSGGSQTIIEITKNKQVYKYFPIITYLDNDVGVVRELKKRFKHELYILKILTKLNTPHIVKLYKVQYCNVVPTSFFKDCEKYTDYLLSNKKTHTKCMYLYRGYPVKLNKGMYVGKLEYCDLTLNNELQRIIKKPIPDIKMFLDTLIFQIIFTLSIIKKEYPYFVHRDLFIRNILVQNKPHCSEYYNRYYLDNDIYDVPVGLFIKLNDFGNAKVTKNPLNPSQDIFNILYDLYNGNNLGAKSLLSLTKNKDKIKFIKKYFNNFMDIKQIDKIIKHKKDMLDWNWTIDEHVIKLIGLHKNMLAYFKQSFKYDAHHNVIHEYD